MESRIEEDSIGKKEIPAGAYYGVHSLRAAENFQITDLNIHPRLVRSLAKIKKAAAITNSRIGLLEDSRAEAISQACDEVIGGAYRDQFIVDAVQGGAGTSINMNMNEVLANRAIEILGGEKGDYDVVHPNNDVNMGQSTNDVIPTAAKITTISMLEEVVERVEALHEALDEKGDEFDEIIKMGRTQLQDAVPIRLGQEFKAYATAVRRDRRRIEETIEDLKVINLGATAVGTGLNADQNYFDIVTRVLKDITALDLTQAEDLIDATQNVDAFVGVSSSLKTCVSNLSKIASDLRLMSSGPRTGLNEINLPAVQAGSSIMPGKVNPVIPEVINQIAYHIMGSDATITKAAEAGQLELNVMQPVIMYNLFQAIEMLRKGLETFVENCIKGIEANAERCEELVDSSVGIITAISPHIGYETAARIAKRALDEDRSVREVILEEEILDEAKLEKILNPYEMTEPGIAGRDILNEEEE
ncbi:aspartate ammonia-lyase [Halarsenatibacter silvermanii]|uniref:aspartate ammonia-lyase n=1 Tax=Halarsenatibacter silvermanii TaxID=321763 RepID=A0A1G9RJ90_9FIRM|nr:aspartate ammonia-lyase [Halarsenatibacter silvermanii]SDM22957.1 aspartate ammonia-lyase [Halarsenatibacter silvermanii]